MKNIGSGVLEGISTRADGSVKLVIATQELDSTDASRLFDLRNKYIKYILSDNNITPIDEQLIDDLPIKDGKKVKTPSQRMRSVLYRIWEQNQIGGDFDNYYKSEMESIIDHYKAKLS